MARILVIEKDADLRRLLALQLERLGHEPVVGLGALDIDLALVEPNGPGALGLAHALRRDSVPLLFVSTEDPSPETTALRPHAHLVKPVTFAQLRHALARAIAQEDRPLGRTAASAAPDTGFGTNASGVMDAASSSG